jgi:hypothetical protein
MINLPGVAAVLAPFLMVVGIVWVTSRAKIEEKRLSLTSDQSAEKATQYTARMAEMEERLRVLERIITDKGYDVATQIEALRDQRRVEEWIEDKSGVQ